MPVQNYILDACAILAFLNDEEGADAVINLTDMAKRGEINLCMNAANLIEVYYDRIRAIGSEAATGAILDFGHLPQTQRRRYASLSLIKKIGIDFFQSFGGDGFNQYDK